MKAIEQFFPVALFIVLYKVVLTFESVDGILKCYHFRSTGFPVELSLLCVSTFESVDEQYFTAVDYFSIFC